MSKKGSEQTGTFVSRNPDEHPEIASSNLNESAQTAV